MNIEKTKLDKLKVSDVAKTFNIDKVYKKINSIRDKRIVEDLTSNLRLFSSLSGDKPEQLVQYWKSYEDHIKRIDEKIEDYKADILYELEVIKNLEKSKKEIIKQKKYFDSKNFEPFTWPMKGCEDKELDKKCHDLIKSHELKYHFGWLLHLNNKDYTERYNSEQPTYELLCDHNGNFKYIRCCNCYKKMIKSENELFRVDYRDMNIYEEPGSK